MRKSFFVILGLSVGLLIAGQTTGICGGGGGGGDGDPAVSSSTTGDPSKGPDGFQPSSTQHQFPPGTGPIFSTSDPHVPINAGPAVTADDPKNITSPAPVQTVSSTTSDDPPNPLTLPMGSVNAVRVSLGWPPIDPTSPHNVFSNQLVPVMGPWQGPKPSVDPKPQVYFPPVSVAGVMDPRHHSGPTDPATELKNIELTSRMLGHGANMLMSVYGTPVVKIIYGVSTGGAGSLAAGDPPQTAAWNAVKGGLYSVISLNWGPVEGEFGAAVFNSVGPVDTTNQPRVPVGGAL